MQSEVQTARGCAIGGIVLGALLSAAILGVLVWYILEREKIAS